MALSEINSAIPKEGLRWRNAYHLPLMWLPNVVNPRKLIRNLHAPITEVLHTSHIQYPVAMEEGIEYFVVEHRLGAMDITVDVVTPDVFPKGLVSRVRQLFDPKFYYGHADYFPHPFKLVDRTDAGKIEFGKKEEHVRKVIAQQQR